MYCENSGVAATLDHARGHPACVELPPATQGPMHARVHDEAGTAAPAMRSRFAADEAPPKRFNQSILLSQIKNYHRAVEFSNK